MVNLSHDKCEFGKYELLYSCSMVNLRVVNLLFGTNELVPLIVIDPAPASWISIKVVGVSHRHYVLKEND